MENKFVNDGSFMAMFKKRMEQEQIAKSTSSNENLPENEKNQKLELQADFKSTKSHADSIHCHVKQTQQNTEDMKLTMVFNQQVQDVPSRTSLHGSTATHSDGKCNDNGHNETGTVSTSLDEQPKKKYAYPIVGKRRGKTPALKTGAVKKIKTGEEKVDNSAEGDAWSKYMAEVKKYSTGISNEDKTRPLVK